MNVKFITVYCLLWAVACTSNSSTSNSSPASTSTSNNASPCSSVPNSSGDYPCDVGAVIQNRCVQCHQSPPQHGAHFPLLRYEDTQQPYTASELRWQRMAQVIEPGVSPHMPYQDAGQLTSNELETLEAWFKACAPPVPEGQGCDQGE